MDLRQICIANAAFASSYCLEAGFFSAWFVFGAIHADHRDDTACLSVGTNLHAGSVDVT